MPRMVLWNVSTVERIWMRGELVRIANRCRLAADSRCLHPRVGLVR
jgi:hypothetical protein